MPDKYQNKYRVPSARASWWNYNAYGLYFVTICTKGHNYFFGNIVNGQMNLSAIGEIVKTEWLKTTELRPDMDLELCEFVVMPNHFHAIIGIGRNEYNQFCRGIQLCVLDSETTYASQKNNKFGFQTKNLASIIRGFKAAVTASVRKINPNFTWQPRYHDHIIRDRDEYLRIAQYIETNTQLWENDSLNPDNINPQ